MTTFGHFKISPCTTACFMQAGVGSPYSRLPWLHSPCFYREMSRWLHQMLSLTRSRTNTGCSAIAAPTTTPPPRDAEREFPLHWYSTRGSQGGFGHPAVSSIRALGEERKFSGGEGDHRTPIFMLSAAELTFCEDQGWRSGVTEVGSKTRVSPRGANPSC